MQTNSETNATHRSQAYATAVLALLILVSLIIALVRSPADFAVLTGSEIVTYRIDPNSADVHELCILPGVGPPTAQKIIDHREKQGPFQTPADLEQVSGIGPKTSAAIEPWVSFRLD